MAMARSLGAPHLMSGLPPKVGQRLCLAVCFDSLFILDYFG